MLNLFRWRWLAFILALGAVFAGCSSLDTQQRKWIFMASASTSTLAADRGDGMKDVWIEHRPGGGDKPVKLHALWLAHEKPDAPVLLYLHGARRNIEGSAFRIRQMRDFGFSVLAVDYRGFGHSTDELPSEDIVYEDARAAWAWLAENHPARARYIYGHSLGGAIAVHLATQANDAHGLIVEGTFTSIPDVFRTMKWGWLPLEPLITQRFDSVSKIDKVKVPVMVVHGSRDRLIPVDLGRRLYERATATKRFVLVEGGTHYSTSLVGSSQYREALKALFGPGF